MGWYDNTWLQAYVKNCIEILKENGMSEKAAQEFLENICGVIEEKIYIQQREK